MKTGDLVTYVPSWAQRAGSPVIEAVVRRVHRDGTVTVEARFVRNPDGSVRPGYLGVKKAGWLPMSSLSSRCPPPWP